MSVLVVDDDPLVLAAVETTLEARGHAVATAPSVPKALEILDTGSSRFDVVMTDVVLEGGSGRTVVERAASQSGVAVVVMSGYSRLALVRDGMIGPERAFVSKPFTTAELLNALAVATNG